MDPSSRLLCRVVGEALLLNFARVAAVTFLYGVFIVLFAVSTALFIKRGLDSRPIRMMFSASIISFLLASAAWGADIAFLVLPVREFVRQGSPTFTTLARARTGFPWANGIIWALQLILSDSIVVWRAWTLHSQQRRLMIFPLLLLLSTFVMVVVSLVLTVVNITYVMYASLYGIALGLSLITNVVVIVMFCYKLWSHRRFLNGLMLQRQRPSRAQTVMTIIIESGLVYCAAQLFMIAAEFLIISRGSRPDIFPLKIITGILWSLIVGVRNDTTISSL
ncbi:hypothetical protein LshimejAT787_1200110 [Lyophyllum shimeji]|uniref:Uncharacterized protein n=1 Tax=Lyophyllum shimeji TaxID=47721 RepID=A0A9P3PTI3_LYOSH|nr:hypothetical protein LshimejAT787_1200110 [Lyophyllum shimeji]